MSLTYQQQQEVKKIVEEKLSTNNIFDTVKDMLNQAYFTRRVDEETTKAAPTVCQRWVDNNLPLLTKTVAEKHMRDNLPQIFHREIANNREITGFISTHLKSVEDTVTRTTDAKIYDIVNASPSLNPVIQHHLAMLSAKNEKQLSDQSAEIKKSAKQLRHAIEVNETLKKDVDSLKRTTNALAGVSAVSLVGVVGLGLQLYSKM